MIERKPKKAISPAGDLHAVCRYLVQVHESDPTEAWLLLAGLVARGVTAWEMSEHLSREELGAISESVKELLDTR